MKTLAQITTISVFIAAYVGLIGAANHWQASATRRYCQKHQRSSRSLARAPLSSVKTVSTTARKRQNQYARIYKPSKSPTATAIVNAHTPKPMSR